MDINFSPQFHCRVFRGDGFVWVAAPHPPTLVAQKTILYRRWQREESLRLRQAGQIVQPPQEGESVHDSQL